MKQNTNFSILKKIENLLLTPPPPPPPPCKQPI